MTWMRFSAPTVGRIARSCRRRLNTGAVETSCPGGAERIWTGDSSSVCIADSAQITPSGVLFRGALARRERAARPAARLW